VNSSVISVIPPEDGLYIGMAMVRSLYYSKIKKMFAVPVWDAKYRYLSVAVCTGLYWMILFTAWGKALAVGLLHLSLHMTHIWLGSQLGQ